MLSKNNTNKLILKIGVLQTRCAQSCMNWTLMMVLETGVSISTDQRFGTAATNRWLQDPIPATMPCQNNTDDGGFAAQYATVAGTDTVPNFNDRMLAVHSQITAIKHDVLAA